MCGSLSKIDTKSSVDELFAPSLFEEVMLMISGSLSIYILSDLRDLARSGSASLPIEDLEAPMTAKKFLEILKANEDSLKASGNYEGLEERLRMLEKTHVGGGGLPRLVEFNDTKANEEMVHAITLNDAHKRVTVIFRGSVTKNDFMTDAKITQTKVKNPVLKLDSDCTETINIHSGFYQYLFKMNDTTNKTRCEEILDVVKELMTLNPGYRLYCCGHSLGGALCTLFGFYAAADDDILQLSSSAVRVISVASPYVGNSKFLKSFQSLERHKRLQHIRVANVGDLVPLGPIVAPKLGMISPIMALKNGAGNLYQHCGMNILLRQKIDGLPSYKIRYPQDHATDEQYAKEIESSFEKTKAFFNSMKLAASSTTRPTVVKYHSCEEHESRLKACMHDLQMLTIDGLYADKTIVGNVLDKDYKPVYMTSAYARVKRIAGSNTLKQSIKEEFKRNSSGVKDTENVI